MSDDFYLVEWRVVSIGAYPGLLKTLYLGCKTW